MMEQDSSRVSLGYVATECACSDCVNNCRFMPGYLIPEDLHRMWQGIEPEAESLADFAKAHLLASPGARVGVQNKVTGQLEVFSVPTLVPARKEDGSCIFLTPENKCAVHYAAPYGCRFFDVHMSDRLANERSAAGLNTILEDNAARGEYKQIWNTLNELKLIAPSPDSSRAAMYASERREPVSQMKMRLAQAFHPLVNAEPLVHGHSPSGTPAYRPGQHRRHIFDFDDGLRLILSRDDRDPSYFVSGAVLHLSGSFELETRLYHRLQTRVRKRTQELERQSGGTREAALPEAVNEMKNYFLEYVSLRFAELTGYTLTARPIWSDGKGIPHWFEEWEAFANATGIEPQE